MHRIKSLTDVRATSAFRIRRAPDSGSGAHGSVLKEGDTLAHYVIREHVGEGPFGRVYKALDTRFDVIVALKVLHTDFARPAGVRSNTVNVFTALSEWDADGFVKVYDAIDTGEHLVIATDYLEGLSVRRLLEVRAGGHFAWDEAEPIVTAVCQVLLSMRPGDVHGDLKPENVLIQPASVTLTDLGLAGITDSSDFVARQGKSPYLAPELGRHPERLLTDPAVDVFAVGAMLYHLLTGQPPEADAAAPADKVDGIAPELDAIVQRALASNPDERFPSIAALLLELAKFAGKPEVAARAEIALHEMPERAPLTPAVEQAPPPAPPPAPEPSAQATPPRSSASLFDESLLGDAGADDTRAQPPASPAEPAPTPAQGGSKAPLAIVVLLVLLTAAGAGWYFLAGGKSGSETAAKAPDAAQAATEAEKAKAEEALALAEKARTDAIAADADDGAPKTFIGAMQSLASAGNALRENNFAAALSEAGAARKAFADAIAETVAAREKAKAEEARAAREAKARAAAPVQAKVEPKPAEKPPVCPAGSVYIAAGTFVMGSAPDDPDRNPGERDNERLRTKAYCIDKYEFPNKKGTKPQRGVTWFEANRACEAAGKRLCSEFEWERACKGPKNYKFPYGNEFDANQCNTEDAGGNDRTLAASGQFTCESGYGVADMSGNVWEWTASRLQSDSQDMLLRGGSFTRPDYHDRCANRYNSMPTVKDEEFGFRCCVDPNE